MERIAPAIAPAREELISEEQGVESDRFGQCHADDGLNEDFAGSSRITADALDGFGADEADANSGREAAEGALNAAGDLSEFCDHGGVSLLVALPPCARLARSRR
jgi:hypothetical protein